MVQLVDGVYFDPLNPDMSQIDIETIAHALAMQCRYAGHCNWHYSVAQHSCYVTDYIRQLYPKDYRLQKRALLHDADEGLGMPDMPRLIKHHPSMAAFREAQARLLDCVMTKFGVPLPAMTPEIHHADDCVLLSEWQVLKHPGYVAPQLSVNAAPVPGLIIRHWYPHRAKSEFLDRWEDLENAI